MYLARYDLAGGHWLQGAAHFPFACATNGTDDLGWSKTLKGALRAMVGKPPLRFSYRFNLDNQGLRRTVFLSTPLAAEAELRRSLASFLRLNVHCEDSTCLPGTRAEHDSLIARFPRYQCLLSLPSYHVGDVWLACDFNIRGLLGELVSEACALGYSLAYHANFEPFSATPGLLRQASRNLLSLRGRQGAPQELIELQERMVERLGGARFLAEEIVGTDRPEASAWLSSVLRERFDAAYRSTRLDPPEFQFEPNGSEPLLSATRHRAAFQTLSVDELVSDCVGPEEVQSTLGWSPPGECAAQWRQPRNLSAADEPLAANVPKDLPAPYTGGEDYIFISYKRQDIHRITPTLRQLGLWGKRIWYDRGIPGGAEWNAIIEERLEHCKLLMLFVSTAAVQSRYVRREAYFADTLNKPILSVALENATLGDGMKMLLNQYQLIDSSIPSFSQQLASAMKYWQLL